MRMRTKLDIEPLGAMRMARVEQAVLDRLKGMRVPSAREPARRAAWKPAVALMLAGAAAMGVGAFGWRAVLAPPPGALAPQATAESSPSLIRATATGSHVALGESALDLAPGSEALVSGDDARGITVALARGSLECEVAPRHGRPPFVVRAGEVSVRVVGTHFRVSRGEGIATVDVERGQVEVTAPGARALLEAGAHWAWPEERERPAAAPTATELTSGALPPSTVSPPAAPVASTEPSRRPRPATAMDRYNLAARLEGGRPNDALALYEDLARGEGPWAMNALFAAGRLEAERRNRPEAQRLLSEYVARFPQGPNAYDARQLLDRLR